jgi:hypothetical protein
MRVDIITKLQPINVLGCLDVEEIQQIREIHIDGQRVPPTIERLILLGLDVETEQYCKDVESLIARLRGGR